MIETKKLIDNIKEYIKGQEVPSQIKEMIEKSYSEYEIAYKKFIANIGIIIKENKELEEKLARIKQCADREYEEDKMATREMANSVFEHKLNRMQEKNIILIRNFVEEEFEEDEEKIHFLYLVDGLIGTEYAKNIIANKRVIPLNANSFINDAIIMKGLKSNKISLKNAEKTVLTMDFTGFPYLAVWTKPKAPFICIEPWMTTADNVNGSGVFRQKTDILLLPPKQEYECKYTVEFF